MLPEVNFGQFIELLHAQVGISANAAVAVIKERSSGVEIFASCLDGSLGAATGATLSSGDLKLGI